MPAGGNADDAVQAPGLLKQAEGSSSIVTVTAPMTARQQGPSPDVVTPPRASAVSGTDDSSARTRRDRHIQPGAGKGRVARQRATGCRTGATTAYLQIGKHNTVARQLYAFIKALDLVQLGFGRVVPADTGRPSYYLSTMLKLYLYGYLNRIQSSRRLEREAGRNFELMWLTDRLAPDLKTIARFRRENGPAIRATCRQFVTLHRRLGLFTGAVVAIDGSKFTAVNNRDKNFTTAKVGKRMEQIEASIARYLATLGRIDREDSDITEAKTSRLKEEIGGASVRDAQGLDGKHALPDQRAREGANRTGTSLHVPACNMKRMIAILDIGPLIKAIQT